MKNYIDSDLAFKIISKGIDLIEELKWMREERDHYRRSLKNISEGKNHCGSAASAIDHEEYAKSALTAFRID